MRPALTLRLVTLLALSTSVAAQQEPVLGQWRGALKTAQGSDSPLIVTIARQGDRYIGSTNGVAEGGDVQLQKVIVSGATVTIEAVAESKLGMVTLSGDLSAEGNVLRGTGSLAIGAHRIPVTFELQRRARQDVIQHQVEQRADYFTGRWTFEYLGGEFPPLSTGGRSGSVTFSAPTVSNFVTGTVEGDVSGKPYQEMLSIGVDPETKAIVYFERRADGLELISLGNWRSPLAIVFQTSPVQAGGRTYQMRRVISILSESSFNITEEFSVDSGPFRRLGNARYTKQ